MTKRISLREDMTYQAGGTLDIDPVAGLIKGVKVLGLISENGRRYLPEAVRSAASMYEGVKSYIDHPDKPMRDYESVFGWFEAVRFVEGDGLRGNYRYNTTHRLAESFVWWAKNRPSTVGFSHNAEGEIDEASFGEVVVTDIVKVHSVDLVADPATTKGIFEGRTVKKNLKAFIEMSKAKNKTALLSILESDMPGDMSGMEMDEPDKKKGGWKEHMGKCLASLLQEEDDESHDTAMRLMKAMKPAKADPSEDKTVNDEDKKAMESIRKEVKALKATVEAYQIKDKLTEREKTARKLIAESGLTKEAVTDLFLENLVEAKDEAAMKALIEDRRTVVGVGRNKPKSAGKGGTPGTYEEFVEAINKSNDEEDED